jgi:hypothetical protein
MAFIHKKTFEIYDNVYNVAIDKYHDKSGITVTYESRDHVKIDIVSEWFECDDMIASTISMLNKRGYRTQMCCSGHFHLTSYYVDDCIERMHSHNHIFINLLDNHDNVINIIRTLSDFDTRIIRRRLNLLQIYSREIIGDSPVIKMSDITNLNIKLYDALSKLPDITKS